MAKRVLKLNEPAKIWNEVVIVRPIIDAVYWNCGLCHFGHVKGYTSCPNNICKQKIDNHQIYFETPN